jgi:hypothetical protein
MTVTPIKVASKVNSDTTKFPLGYWPPGPPPGSDGVLIASRNMPVIGDAESINAEMVYVSVPSELLLGRVDGFIQVEGRGIPKSLFL